MMLGGKESWQYQSGERRKRAVINGGGTLNCHYREWCVAPSVVSINCLTESVKIAALIKATK